MNAYSDSLMLIGMPGSGKSTIGLLLATALQKELVDTDVLIEKAHDKPLQHILDTQGYLALRAIEEDVLLKANFQNHILATGGSAVYSAKAMHHLKTFGPLIFLDVSLNELIKRIDNLDTRGIARSPEQTFTALFSERRALYQTYADITIHCENKSLQEIMNEIIYEEGEHYAEEDA